MPTIKDIEALLGPVSEIPVSLPVGNFPFPLGSVAPFTSGYLRRVRGENAYQTITEAEIKPDGYRLGRERDDGSKAWDVLYWKNTPEGNALATEAQRLVNSRLRSAQLVYQLHANIADTIGMSAENMAKFNTTEWLFDVPKGSFLAGDNRDAWNAVWLPSAVFAATKYLEKKLPDDLVESFGFHELTLREVEPDATEYERLFGGKDMFDGSVYGQQRARLWEALGEKNPAASSLKDAVVQTRKGEQAAPDATVSNDLHDCLKMAICPWAGVYANVGQLTSNRPPSGSSTYQPRIPVCIAILGDKARAEAYVTSLRENGNGESTATATIPSLPVAPGWEKISRDLWLSEFGSHWEKIEPLKGAKRAAAMQEAAAAMDVPADWLNQHAETWAAQL